LKKLGYAWAEHCYHLSYGMVDLPSGKMKSREGTVVDADDMMQEMSETAEEHTRALGKIEGFSNDEASALYKTLGLGALKYFLLKVDPKKRMLFDPQESIQFQGNTGPFVQYTHARVVSILKKAASLKIELDEVNSAIGTSVLCPGAVNTRICESDRNREATGVAAATDSATDDAFNNAAGPIVAAGLEPSDVAGMIVNAIKNDDFWIITHDEWKNVMKERVEGMVNNKLVSGFGG
jgi:hypothetical protein